MRFRTPECRKRRLLAATAEHDHVSPRKPVTLVHPKACRVEDRGECEGGLGLKFAGFEFQTAGGKEGGEGEMEGNHMGCNIMVWGIPAMSEEREGQRERERERDRERKAQYEARGQNV